MSGTRFTLSMLAGFAVLVAAAITIGLWLQARERHGHQRTCHAIAARAVETGRSHYICVDQGGRVVTP